MRSRAYQNPSLVPWLTIPLSAQYGAPSDLDELARMTEDESWGQSSFSKYIGFFVLPSLLSHWR